MSSCNLTTLSRPLAALACSLALAMPSAAQARLQDPSPEVATDELTARAQEHVIKAYQLYEKNYYLDAESELRRAAFFTPNWRPLHFNLAVMAEAQGKLNTAVSEYIAFKPFAVGAEQMITEQRILELDGRRRDIASGYRRKIVGGSVAVSFGIAGIVGGIAMVAIGSGMAKDRAIDSGELDDPMTAIDESMTTASNATRRATIVTAGLLTGLVSVLVLILATPPLRKAVKGKRRLDGLALGPTRLRMSGNGVSLRF